MKLAAHQTQYIPYPGVLNKFFDADIFVFQDDLQFVKQEYQNRNRIRTVDGWRWLTIPVHFKRDYKISEVYPAEEEWPKRHKGILNTVYYRSSYLQCLEEFWEIAASCKQEALSTIGFKTTCSLASLISPQKFKNKRIFLESELNLTKEECSTPTKRLISLCKKLGCSQYISGQGANDYIDFAEWEAGGVDLLWQDFSLKRYTQAYPGWVANLSVIDLMLSVKEPIIYLQ